MARKLLAAVLVACLVGGPAPAAETRQVPGFTPNPGDLLMFEHVPDGLPPRSPLVVALHGCTQSATEFGDDSGWAGLAERQRFALLLPQQREANNADLCFDWFRDNDNRRGRGEAPRSGRWSTGRWPTKGWTRGASSSPASRPGVPWRP